MPFPKLEHWRLPVAKSSSEVQAVSAMEIASKMKRIGRFMICFTLKFRLMLQLLLLGALRIALFVQAVQQYVDEIALGFDAQAVHAHVEVVIAHEAELQVHDMLLAELVRFKEANLYVPKFACIGVLVGRVPKHLVLLFIEEQHERTIGVLFVGFDLLHKAFDGAIQRSLNVVHISFDDVSDVLKVKAQFAHGAFVLLRQILRVGESGINALRCEG